MATADMDVVAFDVRRIRRDMAERGWVQRDLARAAGVSDNTVSRFLADPTNARVAGKLARAMGYTSPRRYLLR